MCYGHWHYLVRLNRKTTASYSIPPFSYKIYTYRLTIYLVLLFVFWYCHKRGREVRLEKERLLTEAEITQLQRDGAASERHAHPLTTTAPEGAPIEQVQEGMQHAGSLEEEPGMVRAGEGEAQYAEGGSLAIELAKEKQKGQAGEPVASASTSS